jgi:hypothetical protein
VSEAEIIGVVPGIEQRQVLGQMLSGEIITTAGERK